MRKHLLTLIIACWLPALLLSQTLNQLDDRGMKQGKWVKTFPNGMTRYTGQFRDDHPTGEFRYFYESGQLQAVTVFSDDGLVGHTHTYHENGQPMADGKYLRQQRDSTWNFYSDIDGQLIATENYKAGKRHGLSIVYFPESGKPSEETTYKNGLKEGPYRKYFPGGELMISGLFKNNLPEGEYRVFFENGKPEVIGQYKNGVMTGEWKYFNEQGEPITGEEYRNAE